MVYACPAWEYATDAHLLKLQRLQNRILHTGGKFDRRKPVSEMHMLSKFLRVRSHNTVM
jgi:hypothetical protein